MKITYKFEDRDHAWEFYRTCIRAKASAAEPVRPPTLHNPRGLYEVETMRVITAGHVLTVRDSARGDQSLIDACNVVLWEADSHGIIIALTPSAERVRAVIVARMDAGEL